LHERCDHSQVRWCTYALQTQLLRAIDNRFPSYAVAACLRTGCNCLPAANSRLSCRLNRKLQWYGHEHFGKQSSLPSPRTLRTVSIPCAREFGKGLLRGGGILCWQLQPFASPCNQTVTAFNVEAITIQMKNMTQASALFHPLQHTCCRYSEPLTACQVRR
jgi:hypothetical protein